MNAALLWHGEKFRLRGKNAEIALTRLKNAKIDLYNVKKTEKDAVTFEVKGKQARKVFAIYPKTWYNKAERGGYEAISLGETGVFPRLKGLQKRAGLLAGAAAFLLITAFADNFVFDAVYTGDGALCRQARRIVRESGVTAFSRFTDAQAEEISAKILSLDGASYASVQKKGTVLYVEARRSPFSEAEPMPGDMTAKHAGTLLSLTVLRGERAARPGSKIVAGTPLVYASLRSGEGESENGSANAGGGACRRKVHSCRNGKNRRFSYRNGKRGTNRKRQIPRKNRLYGNRNAQLLVLQENIRLA